MTPLRKRMIEEMELRNFAPKTVELYVDNKAKFAKHFGKSPDLLGEEHVRQCAPCVQPLAQPPVVHRDTS